MNINTSGVFEGIWRYMAYGNLLFGGLADSKNSENTHVYLFPSYLKPVIQYFGFEYYYFRFYDIYELSITYYLLDWLNG